MEGAITEWMTLVQRMTLGITWSVLACHPPSFSSGLRERLFAAGARKEKIHGKLKQGYDFKRLLGPFLIGVREVGAGGCSIRESEGALTKHDHFELELAAEKNLRGKEDSESAGTILNGALFKNA